jgi:hypothetical protein
MSLSFEEIIDYLLCLLVILGYIIIPLRILGTKKPDKTKDKTK